MLEDLGIDLERMLQKYKAVLFPFSMSNEIAQHEDLSGPVLVAVALGLLLLVRGKVSFGYIYGFGLTGSVGIYLIINLMSHKGQYVEFYSTVSNLGYGLLPFVLLALVSIFMALNTIPGIALIAFFIGWTTLAAAKLFE